MLTTLAIIVLVVLFYLLGKAADLVVVNLRSLGKELGIKVYFLGFVLGFFTSMPELAIGINSTLRGINAISFGNLFGGVIVLLGLVFGLNILLHRQVQTPPGRPPLAIIFLYLYLPLVLSWDGVLSKIDGLVVVIAYFALLLFIYKTGGREEKVVTGITGRRHSLQRVFFVLAGVVSLIILSDVILRITEFILTGLGISLFFIGLVVYAIGTNIPEIMVAVRAWHNNLTDLSYSNLIGSVMSNILLVGVLSWLSPFVVVLDSVFFTIAGFFALLFAMIVLFSWSGRRFVRVEGLGLIIIYILFVGSQILFEFGS